MRKEEIEAFCSVEFFEFFVRDAELIVVKSRPVDRIVVMSDFNLPKITWVNFEGFGLSASRLTWKPISDGLIKLDS
jgi:hypothetical protein